jgi:hypothetical protein
MGDRTASAAGAQQQTIASTPRSRSASVTPRGDCTCAVGSPTMKMTRVAPE